MTVVEDTARGVKTFPSKVDTHEQGVWVEWVSQDESLSEVVLRRPIPMQLLDRYARAAVLRARPKELDDGWYVDVEDLPGVWATRESVQEALEELHEVVIEWALLKIRDDDRDFPILDGINLNVV